MNTSQQDLHKRYSIMEKEELIELYQRGSFTESTRLLLESELRSRGVEPETVKNVQSEKLVEFRWWVVWGWLGLIFGILYPPIILHGVTWLVIVLMVVNSTLMAMVLKFNKYAFLIATILCMNPLLWIINGIYLKRRWNHPKVNTRP